MTQIRIRVIRVKNMCHSSRPPPTTLAKRIEKLNELLKGEISRIVSREIDIPPGTMITITRVETTDNKLASRVYFSVFESEKGDEKNLQKQLDRQTFFIQKILNRRMRIRPVPKIRFLIDKEEKNRERVEKLLSELKID